MMRKLERTKVLKQFNIVMVFIIIVLVIMNIANKKINTSINVISIQRNTGNNPMMRQTKVSEERVISVEEFCEALNKVEGKEVYYVKNDKIKQLNEKTSKGTNSKILTIEELTKKGKGNYRNYTQEDVIILTALMYTEVEQYINNPDAEYVFKLVGSVVLHRVEREDYPDNIKGVIFEDKQYAKTTINKLSRTDIPDKVYEWAEDLLRDGAIGPENLVFQSQSKQGEVYDTYGNQYFCLSSKN